MILLPRIANPEYRAAIIEISRQFSAMTGTERLADMKEKTGIFTGRYADQST